MAGPHRISLLRPNFPTLRLAQLARLHHEKNQLFQSVLSARRPADLDWIKNLSVSAYWQSHYTLAAGKKATTKRPKKLSASFFDLLCVNTFVPLRFAYQKRMGQENAPRPCVGWKRLWLKKIKSSEGLLRSVARLKMR